ncbi:succinate semialdehyde dehydrogenase NADP+ linked [Serendipita sp. 399]|nr:succinate semialdehyde dehydrogenase NADP+ linked [Serendipita sp. 399]
MSTIANLGLKDPGLYKSQGLINGEWISSPSTFSVMNPANGTELAQVSEMTVDDTKQAILAADKAFQTWSQTTAKSRHDILMKFFQLMSEHTDDLGRLITLENGKPFTEGKGEVTYSASFMEWYAEEAVRAYGEVLPPMQAGSRGVVLKQPIGVVSILTPWNFPSAMITRKLGAALAAGCTAVIKPAPETPLSALALAEIANRAGVPKGVINVITASKNMPDIAKEMCENPIVRKISFTGSTRIAKLLAGYAAGTLKKMTIEAGGNAPFIVFDDADIDKAVDGVIASKFRNSGQTCVCANRILVQSSVYADFAAKLAAKVSSFVVGDGFDEKT